MKKTIITLVLAMATFAFTNNVNAQIQKGNVMMGGNISNLNLGLGDNGDVSFSLMPKAAWFVKDGLAVGGYMYFGLLHTGGTEGSALNYGVGPLGRYYISDKNVEVLKKGKFFLEGTAGFDGTNHTKGGSSTNGLGFGFGPGYAYFINENISLEALLQYKGRVGFGSEAYASNLVFSLGFQIYFPKKHIEKMIK